MFFRYCVYFLYRIAEECSSKGAAERENRKKL